ncbi:MAG: hypothetical protein AAF550_05950, partial [Myxococcota bacterium]
AQGADRRTVSNTAHVQRRGRQGELACIARFKKGVNPLAIARKRSAGTRCGCDPGNTIFELL